MLNLDWLLHHAAKLLSGMTAHEIGERFIVAAASREVSSQERLDGARHIRRGNITKKFAADLMSIDISAADEKVIAFDHFRPDFRPQQADVTDEMLGTG